MAKEIGVYIGTYTRKSPADGIYYAKLDLDSGKLKDLKLAARTPNPSFLVIHPNGKYLYAVGEMKDGFIRSFSIDPKTGKLKKINQQSSGGKGPCHLSMDKEGKYLFAANYSSGSAAVFPVNQDGSLKPASSIVQHNGCSVTKRQKGPHAHSINLSNDGRFIYVADLGMDKIMTYKFDSNTGCLSSATPSYTTTKPGAGPRHLAFLNDKVFVINELDSTISTFKRNPGNGALIPVASVSTLPEGFEGKSTCAEIAVGPRGKYLYGSNRGHDSIVVFRINPDGTLKCSGYLDKGIDVPRHFNIDPSGNFCVVGNQKSGSVKVFKINVKTGIPGPEISSVEVGKPICIKLYDVD